MNVVVAGPAGGSLDRWADLLVPAIGRALAPRALVSRVNIGGIDGVTGANQFEARGEPDGGTVLLMPGAATLPWLTGEMRARFDPARWVPLWAGTRTAVFVSRLAMRPGQTVRVAASGPAGAELPALLTLDLLGMRGQPVPAESADAFLIEGQGLRAALQGAAAKGMSPVFTLGCLGPDGIVARDAILPSVPTGLELVSDRAPAELIAVLRATSLAAQLDAGLMLPALTPAAPVAIWRRACQQMAQDPALVGEAGRRGARLVPPETVAACTSTIVGDPAMILALREWLATRYDWRPT